MKYLFIFLILFAGNVSAQTTPDNLCDKYICVAAFNWGYNFGYGGSGSGGGGDTYYLLREDASVMLREDGSKFLREDAP